MTANVLFYTVSSGMLLMECVLGYMGWIASGTEDVMKDVYITML